MLARSRYVRMRPRPVVAQLLFLLTVATLAVIGAVTLLLLLLRWAMN